MTEFKNKLKGVVPQATLVILLLQLLLFNSTFYFDVNYNSVAIWIFWVSIAFLLFSLFIGISINRYTILLWVLNAIVLLSTIINNNLTFVNILYILYFTLSTTFLLSIRKYRINFKTFLMVAGVACFCIAVSGFFYPNMLEGRIAGFAGHPNTLASITTLSIFCFFTIYLKCKNKLCLFVFIVPLIPSLIIIYLSGSRGSLVFVLLFFIVYYLLAFLFKKDRKSISKKQKIALIIAFAAIVIAVVILVLVISSRGKAAGGMDLYTLLSAVTSGRSNMWLTDFPFLFVKSPILGYGVNCMPSVFDSLGYKDLFLVQFWLTSMHSFIFDSLIYSGVLGTVVLICCLISMFNKATRKLLKALTVNSVYLAFVTLGICLLIYFCLDIGLLWNHATSTLFFWLSMGYITSFKPSK